MENNLKKAFQNNVELPDENLAQNIWQGICRHEKKNDRNNLIGYGSLFVLALAFIVPAFKDLSTQFSQSGFFEYLSMVFSGGTVSKYSSDLMLSLVESLPALKVAISLTLVFVIFGSFRQIIRHIKFRNSLQTI